MFFLKPVKSPYHSFSKNRKNLCFFFLWSSPQCATRQPLRIASWHIILGQEREARGNTGNMACGHKSGEKCSEGVPKLSDTGVVICVRSVYKIAPFATKTQIIFAERSKIDHERSYTEINGYSGK
jgi:hypothetical protein